MKIFIFLIVLILTASFISSCSDKVEQVKELMVKIETLELEKKQLNKAFDNLKQENSTLKNDLNKTIDDLKQENSTLKKELITLVDKDKKNINQLFQ